MIIGILPNVNSINLNRVVNSVISARLHTGRLKANPAENRKKDGDTNAVAKKRTKLFFSPANEWCLPAPSLIKPEEREFVVDSGAPMHMLNKKDLNTAELETVRVSQSPTTVVTASGKASPRYTGRSLTRKTLRRSRIFLRVDWWSETTIHQRWQTDKMQRGELRTDRCPWFIDRLFKLSYTYFSNIFIGGNRNSHEASSINKK